jgi:hypothetical protein
MLRAVLLGVGLCASAQLLRRERRPALLQEERDELQRMRKKREANIWSVHTMHGAKKHKTKEKPKLVVLAGTSHPQLVDKVRCEGVSGMRWLCGWKRRKLLAIAMQL